jgi:hypothetical protein
LITPGTSSRTPYTLACGDAVSPAPLAWLPRCPLGRLFAPPHTPPRTPRRSSEPESFNSLRSRGLTRSRSYAFQSARPAQHLGTPFESPLACQPKPRTQ